MFWHYELLLFYQCSPNGTPKYKKMNILVDFSVILSGGVQRRRG